jgi:hypothetical protein
VICASERYIKVLHHFLALQKREFPVRLRNRRNSHRDFNLNIYAYAPNSPRMPHNEVGNLLLLFKQPTHASQRSWEFMAAVQTAHAASQRSWEFLAVFSNSRCMPHNEVGDLWLLFKQPMHASSERWLFTRSSKDEKTHLPLHQRELSLRCCPRN